MRSIQFSTIILKMHILASSTKLASLMVFVLLFAVYFNCSSAAKSACCSKASKKANSKTTTPLGPDQLPICKELPSEVGDVCEMGIADATCKKAGPDGLLPYGRCDQRFVQCVKSDYGFIIYAMTCPENLVFSTVKSNLWECVYPKDNSDC